jgi:hypothetical protein
VSFLYGKGHRGHLTRANHSGLTPTDLGLEALLRQAESDTGADPHDTCSGSAGTSKGDQKKKKKAKKRKKNRSSSPSSSSSSSSSSGGFLQEPEDHDGYRDPHASARNGDGAASGAASGADDSMDPRAAAQWRKMWHQERNSADQEWADKLAEEAAAESGEWGGAGPPGSTGMGWGEDMGWEEEEQADATAQEDWMDELAAELQRKRAAESDARRRRAEEQSAAAAAGGGRKQQYGDDKPRPHNGGAGRSKGIPGHRPGVGSGTAGGDFAGMRGGGGGAGPTKESIAATNARLRGVRKTDEARWDSFVAAFGKAPVVSKRRPGAGPGQPRTSPAAAAAASTEDAANPPGPPQPPLRASDIPWPGGMSAAAAAAGGDDSSANGNVLSLPSDLPASDVKAAVRAAQRRWHPDKFAQRFGEAMALLVGGETEREKVLARVKLLAQQINEIEIPETAATTGAGDDDDDGEHVGPSRPPAT